jgi:glycerophosphoryl diester phosphodiesterase
VKIIGHRGARGLETENTLESIQRALDLGVDGVEIDVWTSKDQVPLVSHDSSLLRTTGYKERIFNMTYREIAALPTFSGQAIPTAREALITAKNTMVFLDIKDFYLSRGVLGLLRDFKSSDILVTSSNHSVLLDLHRRRPDIPMSPSTMWHPLETVDFIRRNGLYGLSLYYQSFNPIVYWLARRNGINIRLYTVNNASYVSLLRRLNFEVDLTTDHPHRLLQLLSPVYSP